MEWRPDNFDHRVPVWAKNLGGWVRDVVDFCYQGVCPSCREVSAAGHELCAECSTKLNALANAPACFYCGKSLAYYNAPCPHCAGRGIAHYERIIRLGKFDSPIRTLIHQLKYHRASSVGEIFADQLLKLDHVESLLLEADCLLPVPLHGMREFVRGYNQAEVIAARLSRATGIPIAQGACRIRSTEAQTHLHSKAQRMANLKGAFELRDESQIAGRRVVVIDDVVTTGATLQAFARTLRSAKPAKLSALVVAVAEQGRR